MEVHILPGESVDHLVKRMEALALVHDKTINLGNFFRVRHRGKFAYILTVNGYILAPDREYFINRINKHYGMDPNNPL